MRIIQNINDNWKFSKDLKTWEEVTLPHTWNAIDGQDGGNDYFRGVCSYTRKFNKPLEEGKVFLEINGASNIADVYLNGESIAHHKGGYSTFRVELKNLLAQDNTLTINVDNRENNYCYPQKADFTFYGGLYRDVNLIIVPINHFELVKDGHPGIHVTPEVKGKNARVIVETWQVGEGDVKIFVNEQRKVVPSIDGYAKAEFIIEDVHLWNGIKDPYMYVAKACFDEDEVETKFGCRSFSFDQEKGFFLNGESYPLRGVSRHQDRWQMGNALTLKEHKEDMELIKEIGANTIRLAHYQHAKEFYDLCDEYGMIVWAEIPYITEHMPNGRKNTLDQMRELITQCYNHPSIICWGLSNEIAVHGVSEDLLENHKLLNDLCHLLDKTRPTTMAHAFMLEHESPLIAIPDISSYNLYFGWYLGNLEQNDSFFDEYHQKFPNRVMGFSEYGADCNVKYQTSKPDQGDYSEQYQCKYHEYILDCIDRHSWLWSTHCWNMFDFGADGRDEGGSHGLNQKGLVSIDRKIKKDAFYLYKAAWNKDDKFVHICGSRYIDRVDNITEIKIYSNLDSVDLYMDGKLLETKKGNRIFTFNVEISGEHLIEAKSGNYTDSIKIRKVDKPNPEYVFNKAGSVTNWFDEEGFDSSCFSIRDSFGSLMTHPKTKVIVDSLMQKMIASRGDVAKSANNNPQLQKMLAGMSFEALLKQAGDAVPKEEVDSLNKKLQQIKK